MTSRKALAMVMVLAALSACGWERTANVPRPTKTLEPMVEPTRTVKPRPNAETACSLITSEERRKLAGTTMNETMPSNPLTVEHECTFVHSFKETVKMSISVEAMDARDWAKHVGPALGAAMASPEVSRKKIDELRKASLDTRRNKLSRERACDIYWLMASLRGYKRGDEIVYPAGNTQMASVVSTSCIDGVFTSVNYAERYLRPTPTLGDLVVEVRKSVEQRSVERFGSSADEESESTATPEPTADTESSSGS